MFKTCFLLVGILLQSISSTVFRHTNDGKLLDINNKGKILFYRCTERDCTTCIEADLEKLAQNSEFGKRIFVLAKAFTPKYDLYFKTNFRSNIIKNIIYSDVSFKWDKFNNPYYILYDSKRGIIYYYPKFPKYY